MGRWDRRAGRLAERAGEGTVLAACRALPPAGDDLEGGLRAVAGSLGARLGRAVDGALGRDDDGPAIEQSAVDELPDDGYLALVVGGRLVLLDSDADRDEDVVVARWPVGDVVLVSSEDVSSLTLNVTRLTIVLGGGSSVTVDVPRQGFTRDIDRFVQLLHESAGLVQPDA